MQSLLRLLLARRSPRSRRLPDDGAPAGVLDFITDVQEATFHALTYTARERLARRGISIGQAATNAGTLGGLVRHRETGAVAILSHHHVLANSNQGTMECEAQRVGQEWVSKWRCGG